MLVYRVETSSGTGPYRAADGSFLSSNARSKRHNNRSHPGAYADPGIRDNFNSSIHYFGFTSMRSLASWFYHDYTWLKRHGLRIAIYDAPDSSVISSSYQVIFPRDSSTLVDRLPLPPSSSAFRVLRDA